MRQAADSQTASQHALSALAELCQIYWRPVYVFLRRQGIAQHDAQDLTQAFFADLIESRAYARADPTKGRFRSFLLGTLKHFVAHARDRERAQKRGGDPFTGCSETSLSQRLGFMAWANSAASEPSVARPSESAAVPVAFDSVGGNLTTVLGFC